MFLLYLSTRIVDKSSKIMLKIDAKNFPNKLLVGTKEK